MDRILFAIIASAVLLLLGAAGLYVTKTADSCITPARSGSPVEAGKHSPSGTITIIPRKVSGGAWWTRVVQRDPGSGVSHGVRATRFINITKLCNGHEDNRAENAIGVSST